MPKKSKSKVITLDDNMESKISDYVKNKSKIKEKIFEEPKPIKKKKKKSKY